MPALPLPTRLPLALLGLALLAAPPLQAASFVYQGQLDDRGAPANGRYDLQLALYRTAEHGVTLAAPIVFSAVEVVGGRFRLQFDAALGGTEAAWVELAVRDVGGGPFSAIPGRTLASQVPAAIGACWSSVGDSGSNPATHFLGTTDAQPLVLRTGNAQSLRLEPSAELFGGNPITANVIAGSNQNSVTAGVRGATISGGGVAAGASDPQFSGEAPNRVTDAYGTVGGGYANRAGDDAGSTVDRGFATVGGGLNNSASGIEAVIAGGLSNSASGRQSSIGGGQSNMASGSVASTVGGGAGNTASADNSTVSGGFFNCAGAAFSWAGGSHAKVRPSSTSSGAPGSGCSGVPFSGDADGDAGSFVWADNQSSDFTSTGNDQFAIRARGGLRWAGTGTNSTTSPAFVHQAIVGSNTCDGGSGASSRTYLNHPLLNNNPDAVIVLTANFGSTAGGGAAPPRNPVGLYYNASTTLGCPAGRWVIYQLSTAAEALNNGVRFNAWFVLP